MTMPELTMSALSIPELSIPVILSMLMLGLLVLILGMQMAVLRRQSKANQIFRERLQQVADLEARLAGSERTAAQFQRDIDELRHNVSLQWAHPEDAMHMDAGPYAQAIDLINQGYSPEVLMEQCQISRGEAELLLSLHRQRENS